MILSANGDSVDVVTAAAAAAVPRGDDLRDSMVNEEPIMMLLFLLRNK
jgi:hypothetical protein